jgi:NADH-quinone oxidoreductase chain G
MSIKLGIQINNKAYEVRANASILQACEEVGIHLPRFCYHEKLSVSGNCRICLVEVEKSPKPVVSCAMPVSKGMVIFTDTPLVKKAREAVLEFLLINHPLDCPICDQGGECDLQDETLEYASDRGRFYEFKRSVEDKEVGPIIKTIMTRCIHCTRCVRFSTEVAGQEMMGAFGRGEETEIGTYVQEFIKTELSGNLADICPVGALTSKPYAYKARSWELQKVETIDFFDSLCADIVVQTRQGSKQEIKIGRSTIPATTREEIVRILPRSNGLYEDNWISDKTRYAFDSLRKQRLVNFVSNDMNQGNKKIAIGDMLLDLSESLSNNAFNYGNLNQTDKKRKPVASLGFLLWDTVLDLEGIFALNEAMKFYGSSNIQLGNVKSSINFDIPNFYTLNNTVDGLKTLTTLLLISTNVRFEASLLNTALRKHQQARDLFYYTIGVYNSLNIRDQHLGNTLKTLVSFIENKSQATLSLVTTKNSTVYLGGESLKSINGSVLQNISRLLGQKLFLKTKVGERLGVLNSSTSGLMMNHLGIAPGVRSVFNSEEIQNKEIDLLFAVQPYKLNTKKWISKNTKLISFATHKTPNLVAERVIPLKTPYEKNGYFVALDSRIRKSYKAVTAPLGTTSVDVFFASLMRLQAEEDKWISTLGRFWRFTDELKLHKNLEVSHCFTSFFHLKYLESTLQVKYVLLPRTVENFYTTDLLSSNSLTMIEASLFLNKNTNYLKTNGKFI